MNNYDYSKFSNYSNYSLNYICGLTRINHIYNNKEKANKEKIGKRLKEFRKHLGLSQQKFSDTCHIPQSTYSHYEIGYKLITTFNLYTISKTYNVSLDYLVGRNDNPTIEQ